MAEISSDIYWQKNLFNRRYNVEQQDIDADKLSPYARLADMTEKANRKKKKFPWGLILTLLAAIMLYSYSEDSTLPSWDMASNYQTTTVSATQSTIDETPLPISHIPYLPPQPDIVAAQTPYKDNPTSP